MQKDINDLYQKINDLKTKEEFEKEIKNILDESDGLFDRKTAALLIVEKLDRNNSSITKIKDIKDKRECSVIAKITKISKTRNYQTKKGFNGRVINIEIADDTGTCNLVLWNKDVDLVKNNKIKKGSIVKIINGYIKNGYNGLEINIGRYGLLEIKDDKEIKIQKNHDFLTGKLVKIESTRPFFKDDGEYGFVTNIMLECKNKKQRLTIWNEKVKEIQDFKIGDNIKIENIDIKNRNGEKEIHLNNGCKITKL